jgi:hypothetical protein
VHGTDEKLELKSEPRNQKINDKKWKHDEKNIPPRT